MQQPAEQRKNKKQNMGARTRAEIMAVTIKMHRTNDAAIQRLRTTFRDIGRAIEQGSPTVPRASLDKSLYTLPAPIAKLLYTDLCRIQMARDDESVDVALLVLQDVLDWSARDQLLMFHKVIVDDGSLVGKVADCVEFDEKQRREKWNRASRTATQTASAQKSRAQQQLLWSAFLVSSRYDNETAYTFVRRRLADDPPVNRYEWHTLLIESPEKLKRQEASFWYSIRHSHCSCVEKRAICHKITLMKELATAVPKIRLEAMNQQILTDVFRARDTPTSQAPKRRMCSLFRLIKRGGRRTIR